MSVLKTRRKRLNNLSRRFARLDPTHLKQFHLLGSASGGGAAGAALVATWKAGLLAAGGTLGASSEARALSLANALVAHAAYSKIKAVWPYFGSNIIAARMPLIDVLGKGIAGNNNFLDAHFSESTGVQGAGGRQMDSKYKGSELGTTNNGGVGISIRTLGSGVWTMASRAGGDIFGIAIYSGELFYWGTSSTPVNNVVTPIKARYYAQRSSATLRTLYRNAVSVGTNTSSDLASNVNGADIYMFSDGAGSYCDHQFNYAFLTDGTLTGSELTSLDALLETYIVTATGR